jgi:hypothetical protein
VSLLLSAANVIEDIAPNDTVFRWAALIIGQIVIFTGLLLSYFSTRKGVSNVSDQATLAATLAAPTGNGFAKDVKDALAEIKASVSRVEHKVDTHIQDHARVSLTKDRNE